MKLVRNISIILTLLVLLTTPSLVLAVKGSATDPKATFENPLSGAQTVTDLILRVIQWLIGISLILAFFSLVWGGIWYIISLGDESRVKQAKAIIFWAVIGVIIILIAYILVNTVAEIFGVAAP